MRFLRLRSEVDFGSIGLLGHSSGALAASLVAAESEDIEFLVMIAGPGVPGNEVIRKQAAILLEASGTSQKEIERDDALRQALMKAVADSSAGDNPVEIIEQGLESYLAELPKNEREAARPDAATLKQFEAYATPWFRFLLSHDPRPVLRKVSCPVLALYGELDIQVSPEQNLPEVELARSAKWWQEQGRRACGPQSSHADSNHRPTKRIRTNRGDDVAESTYNDFRLDP